MNTNYLFRICIYCCCSLVFICLISSLISFLSCEDCTVKWRCGKCRSKSLSSSSFQCSICSKTFPDTVPECTNKLLLYCTGHRSINMVIGDLGTLGRCSCVRHEQYILWHNFFFNFCQDLENFQKLNFDS